MEIIMAIKKDKNYSTARIYIEDLARLRLIAKHTGKTQISTLHDLVKEKWTYKVCIAILRWPVIIGSIFTTKKTYIN